MNQEAQSNYLEILSRFRFEHQDRVLFLNELQERFPCSEKPFRLDTWDIHKTVMIYYGLDYSELTNAFSDQFHFFEMLRLIDFEEIKELLINHLGHQVCPARDCVRVNKFVSFLQEKRVPVPKHFLTNVVESIEEDSKANELKTKKRKKESLRKDLMSSAAELYWLKEKKEIEERKIKEYTRPAQLARKPIMNELVVIINKIGNLEAISGDEFSESGVDPEWFGKQYPGDIKAGRMPKKRKK